MRNAVELDNEMVPLGPFDFVHSYFKRLLVTTKVGRPSANLKMIDIPY